MNQLTKSLVSRCSVGCVSLAVLVGGCNKAPFPAPTQMWAPGTVQLFELELDSSLALGNGPPINLHLTSKLAVSARRESDTTTLGIEIREPQLTSASDSAQLRERIQRPFEVQLQNGQLSKVAFEAGASNEAVGIWRTIAANLAFSCGAKAQQSWTASEADAAGQYQAKYQIISPSRIEKRKLNYATIMARPNGQVAMPGLAVDVSVAESKGEFTFRDGRIAERWSHETLDSKWNNAPFAHSDTKFRLKLETASKDKAFFAAPAQAATVLASQPYQDPRIDKRAMAAAQSKDLNFDDVISELRKESAKQGTPGHEFHAFGQMVAILKAHDERVAEVATLIKRSDPASRILLDAFGSASTPSTQSALIDLAELESLDMDLRKRASYAAIRGTTPTPKLVEHLRRWMKEPEFEQYGVYGLGTAARHLREAGSLESSNEIVGLLIKELATATELRQSVDLLRGLANAADPATFDAVKPRLEDARPLVRTAAVEVIVRLNRPDGSKLLAARLSHEKDRVARVSLADSLRSAGRTPELVAAVKEHLQSEKDQQVLYKLIELAGLWIESVPELRPILTRLSKSDIEPQVKGLIVGILEPSKKPGDK